MADEKKPQPIFVVGTEIEARTIRQSGFTCLVLTDENILGVTQAAADSGCAIVGVLDRDAAEELRSFCAEKGVPFFAKGKELIEDPCALMEANTDAVLETKEARRRAAEHLLERRNVYNTAGVVSMITAGAVVRELVRTGIRSVDEALGGGLPTGGLTVLGAVSSLGKTTFSLQIADNMARYYGRNVLFVTIEQSRTELVSKSLSRIIGEAVGSGQESITVTASAMTSRAARERWTNDKKTAFMRAAATYTERIAPRMWMLEADNQPTVEEVREAAEAITHSTGEVPCVFIDYLQLLAPALDKMTEKQAIDYNVTELRHMARDLKTCVFVISSLNRASYGEGVTLDSFKESGAIEYGADILLGLQSRGFDEELDKVASTKQKRAGGRITEAHKTSPIREVEIKVLKNRHWGLPQHPVPLKFDAPCSLFTDDEGAQLAPRRKVK